MAEARPSSPSDDYREKLLFEKVYPFIAPVDEALIRLEETDELLTFIEDKYNKKAADQMKKTGMQAVKKDEHTTAIMCWTEMMSHVKPKDKLYGHAFGSRALTLHKMGLYRECLEDIKIATENNCPPEILRELRTPKAEAELKAPTQPTTGRTVPILLDEDRHPSIQSASSSVQIRFSPEFGRHVVCAKPIKMGETIAIEKAYAIIPIRSSDFPCNILNCYQCMTMSPNPIPCHTCSQVQYCTEKCKEESWNKYHKYECPILRTLIPIRPLVSLVVKVALSIHNYADFTRVTSERDMMFRSDRFDEVIGLENHYRLHPPEVHRKFSDAAAQIYHVVKNHTKYFDDVQSPYKHEIFKGLLLRLFFINAINCRKILKTETIYDKEIANGGFEGDFTFLSLLNHSCAPNAGLLLCDDLLTTVAFRDIKVGETICCTYGPQYFASLRDERAIHLKKHFYFDCNCEACRGNWPILRVLSIKHGQTFVDKLQKVNESIQKNKTNRKMLGLLRDKVVEYGRTNIARPSVEWYMLQTMLDDCIRYMSKK